MRSWPAFCPRAHGGGAVGPTKAIAPVWRSHDSVAGRLSRVCPAMDVCALSATELAAALRRRELTPLDALEAVLERADAITEEVNPYALRLDERARAAATAAGEMLSRG